MVVMATAYYPRFCVLESKPQGVAADYQAKMKLFGAKGAFQHSKAPASQTSTTASTAGGSKAASAASSTSNKPAKRARSKQPPTIQPKPRKSRRMPGMGLLARVRTRLDVEDEGQGENKEEPRPEGEMPDEKPEAKPEAKPDAKPDVATPTKSQKKQPEAEPDAKQDEATPTKSPEKSNLDSAETIESSPGVTSPPAPPGCLANNLSKHKNNNLSKQKNKIYVNALS